MNKRLCIGIIELTPSWKIVLDTLGVWYEELDRTTGLSPSSYSAIIINKHPEREFLKALFMYAEEGGAIIETGNSFGFTSKEKLSRTFVKTLINQNPNKELFSPNSIDLHTKCLLYKDSDIFEGLINIKNYGKGVLGFFGADIASLIQDQRFKRKRFYHSKSPFPDELVSTVSKYELLELFEHLLKELHFKTQLPFIKKWTSPAMNPVFCFRIDSDFGDKKSITDLYDFLESHKIKATWFLHVEAHEQWLNVFKKFKDQEIALHGYQHGTSKSQNKIQKNINCGLVKLEEAGFEVNGFCAPYGIWNKGLKSALSEFDFSYTSEFTFTCDGIPIQPNGAPLQIPTHPISTGSLSRKKYSISEMASYFEETMTRKLGNFEPVIFYHHPLQPGLEAFKLIFNEIISKNCTNLTFSEFAAFWKSRKDCSFEAHYDSKEVIIDSVSNESQILQISCSHSGFNLLDGQTKFEIKKTPEFHYSNTYLPDSELISELVKSDIRLIKTSVIDWKNRIRL